MRTLRKLVLGETWTLPIGILVSVAVAGVLGSVAGSDDWWEDSGASCSLRCSPAPSSRASEFAAESV